MPSTQKSLLRHPFYLPEKAYKIHLKISRNEMGSQRSVRKPTIQIIHALFAEFVMSKGKTLSPALPLYKRDAGITVFVEMSLVASKQIL